ncbi:MAG: GTPase HflX [Nitrososphaerales archaeon]
MNRSAILVTYPQEDSVKEALALADTMNYRIVETVTQRHLTKSKYGIGSGKAEELAAMVEDLEPDVIIFDEVLKPTQTYNLARLLQMEIIDRERLILEIFEKRASSAESSIQVKLAQLRYEMARAREKVRLAKRGEQPGFYGLGRYEVDDYYSDIKRRISTLKQKLARVAKRRELYRHQRKKQGFPGVSLAGYTSAGKTTLLNTLVGESHDTGKGMFTTLATYARALELRKGKVLISDTVGFISKLPAYMIEAFKSTLDELTFSTLVLLVIDISEPLPEVVRKYESCVEILNELHVPESKVLCVLNKIDLASEEDAIARAAKLGLLEGRRYLTVSAKTGHNIDRLKELVSEIVFEIKAEEKAKKKVAEGVSAEAGYLEPKDVLMGLEESLNESPAQTPGSRRHAIDSIGAVRDEDSGS